MCLFYVPVYAPLMYPALCDISFDISVVLELCTYQQGSAIREKLSEYGVLQPLQVPDVLSEIRELKESQDGFTQQLTVLKKENSRLWQDVAKLRFQHAQQQQVINKVGHSTIFQDWLTFSNTNFTSLSKKVMTSFGVSSRKQ